MTWGTNREQRAHSQNRLGVGMEIRQTEQRAHSQNWLGVGDGDKKSPLLFTLSKAMHALQPQQADTLHTTCCCLVVFEISV